MPDKNLSDNGIKKALDICSKSTNGCSHSKYTCEDCYLNGQPMCSAVLIQDTIDLINRLQAENKKNENIIRLADKTIATLRAENERLKEHTIEFSGHKDPVGEKGDCGIVKYCHHIAKAKTEAYKEFVELAKSRKRIVDVSTKFGYEVFAEVITVEDIDNLLKELVGDGSEGGTV